MDKKPTEDAEKSRSSRRALLTGGAVVLGGAVLGSQGTADAANGNSWLVGRTTNTESATTKLTMSGNAAAVNVTNSNTGTQGHGMVAYASNGYALAGDSTHNHGAVIKTHSNTHWGIIGQNLSTATNSAGAIRADGGPNFGILATGSPGISGHSDGGFGVIASTSGSGASNALLASHNGPASNGAAIFARGNQNSGLVAITDNPNLPAITAGAANSNSTAISGSAGPPAAHTIRDFVGTDHGAGEFLGKHGVVGVSSSDGYGVAGGAFANNGRGIHAYGDVNAGAWALVTVGKSYMSGNLTVNGNLSKSSGSFKIDHPQDPANKYLYHSFVESPDMMNVYNGTATADARGNATVELPKWFETLNRDFRYQLTAIGQPAPDLHIKSKVSKNKFTIAGAHADQEVSWQVTGIRQDSWANDHRIPVEEDKPKAERGTYLHPEGFGKPASAGLAAKFAPQPHHGAH